MPVSVTADPHPKGCLVLAGWGAVDSSANEPSPSSGVGLTHCAHARSLAIISPCYLIAIKPKIRPKVRPRCTVSHKQDVSIFPPGSPSPLGLLAWSPCVGRRRGEGSRNESAPLGLGSARLRVGGALSLSGLTCLAWGRTHCVVQALFLGDSNRMMVGIRPCSTYLDQLHSEGNNNNTG